MSGLSLAQRIAARGLTGTLDAIALANGVTAACVLGRERTKIVVAARHEFMRALRARGMSYPEIGSLTGRDHTTVMAACAAGEARERMLLDHKVRAGLGPGVRSYRPADVRHLLRVI